MKNSNMIFTTALLAMTAFLTACPAKTRQGDTVYQYEEIPGRDMQDGGSHTGGGAGGRGKMLESFREKELMNKEPFKSRIMPLIKELYTKQPDLAADLMHIAAHRQWYFMPTDLAKIPAAEMITTIRGGGVDQIAIQNENEIWFDSRQYLGFTEVERADGLLHELVMGVRLMEFQTPYDHCMARASRHLITEERFKYEDDRKNCANRRLDDPVSYSVTRNTKKLDAADYIKVRNTTIALSDAQRLSTEELQMIRNIDLRRGSHQ